MSQRSPADARSTEPLPTLTPDEAIEIARDVARRNNWPWEGPVSAELVRLVARRPEWRVQASAVYVIIDDASGHPFIKRFVPRRPWQRPRRPPRTVA
jgi:hypothetical protein